jgi:hypothetical protein
MEIEIPDTAKPGDTIRIEFKILATALADQVQAESECKRAVASDPRLDIQGSSRMVVGDQSLMRDVLLLSVFATVRRTLRETHEPIDFEPLSSFEVYLWATVTTGKEYLGGIGVFIDKAAEVVADTVDAMKAGAETAKEATKWLPLVVVGVLLLWLWKS